VIFKHPFFFNVKVPAHIRESSAKSIIEVIVKSDLTNITPSLIQLPLIAAIEGEVQFAFRASVGAGVGTGVGTGVGIGMQGTLHKENEPWQKRLVAEKSHAFRF